tara:strand:+ start:117 stop:752 length:636 start_codon:yes stop_codon:yes gene_type:complete
MFESDNIARLFSTPVFQSPETYKFNKSELEFIDKQRENAIKNQSGNLFSKNNYVLESPELKNLKEFCNNNLFIFFYDSFKVKKDIEIYITQSWINFNQKNTSHHRHKHVNSIISSVIFIKGEMCPITFYNSERNLFGNLLSFEDFTAPNENNNSRVYFNNQNGKLFLFPSTLMHSVERNNSEVERISLSFNTFIKGQLGGAQNSLQTLNIK